MPSVNGAVASGIAAVEDLLEFASPAKRKPEPSSRSPRGSHRDAEHRATAVAFE
jgi:hypothetical protein